MGLNIQKGNMYGFVTHTWNTIKGRCPHNCSYCYMKPKWDYLVSKGHSSCLRIDGKELKTDLGEGNFIFVGSSCDIFANNMPVSWIAKTLEHCRKYPKNKYLFQSKNTIYFANNMFQFPENSVFCTTLETTNCSLFEKYSGGASPSDRITNLATMRDDKIMITIEPVMDFFVNDMLHHIKAVNPIQVNIGADSGHNNLPEPSKAKILMLIKELEKFTTVYQKENLGRLLK